MALSEIVGTPQGHRMGSVRFRPKICGYPTISVRFPYDLRTGLTQNVDESQSKKSYDARINCKRKCRSPRSPTMSKSRRENCRPKIMITAESNRCRIDLFCNDTHAQVSNFSD